MKKKLVIIMGMFLGVLFVFGLIKVSNNKAFERTIDEKLYNIIHQNDPNVMMSSNPYDYIKGESSKADYKYIVSHGEKSLNYMLRKFADSDKNGLEEYIMAIACSEIIKGVPLSDIGHSSIGSSGREWYNNLKNNPFYSLFVTIAITI